MNDSIATLNIKNLSISILYDARTRCSFCWKYFGNLVFCDEYNKRKILNPEQVYCSACLNEVKADNEDVSFRLVKVKSYNKTVSTGNLTRHLRDQHHIKDESPSVNKSDKAWPITPSVKEGGSTSSKKAKIKKYDKTVLARDLVLWYCKSLLPLDYLCDEAMVDFFKKYNIVLSEDQLPSRSIVNSALSDLYDSLLQNVKQMINVNAAQHFALAFDSWTDQRRLKYITFTLHYLTCDFELKTLTLTTQIVAKDKTADKIEHIIKNIKKDFGLANNNIHAVTDADEEIKRAVLSANMTHHQCLGHGLHTLVTVDGINSVPEIASLVVKCKNIIKAVRHHLPELEANEKVRQEILCSIDNAAEVIDNDENDPLTPSNLTVFENLEAQMLHKDENDPLAQSDITVFENPDDLEESKVNVMASTSKESDFNPSVNMKTPTRWYSVLEMLESIIHVGTRSSTNNLLKKICQNDLKVNQNEWNLLGDLVNFLQRFRVVYEIICSQATINVSLIFRSEIIDILNSVSDNESFLMFTLKRKMSANVNKRFPVTRAMVAAALLDNRFISLKEVDSYLETNKVSKACFLASYVKDLIKADDDITTLLNVIDTSANASTSNETPSIIQKLSIKHSVNTYQGNVDDPIDQECRRYFASAYPEEPKDGNLLSFWNDKKKTFPWLSVLAKSLLCVPAISKTSQRVFSVAGLQLSAKRSRLNPTRINKIIFIHDNYTICQTSEKH